MITYVWTNDKYDLLHSSPEGSDDSLWKSKNIKEYDNTDRDNTEHYYNQAHTESDRVGNIGLQWCNKLQF